MQFVFQYPVVLVAILALAFAEYFWRMRVAGRGYDLGAALASLGVAVGGAVLKPLGAIVIGGTYLFFHEIAPLSLPIEDRRVWAIGFLALEFSYYWFHRWSHTIRWLWATHVVHHSAAEFTLPAAIRLGWTGVLSGGWLVFAPMVLAGFPPLMVGTLLGLNLLYQYFLHTEAVGKLGPLELVLNTPSHHRVHHSSDEGYLDSNFGGVVIVFDRLFGTYKEEPADRRLRYGLVHPITSRNPVKIALHEWVRMWSDARNARGVLRWRALFGRPGTSLSDVVPHERTTPSVRTS